MKITYWSDFACPYCYIGEYVVPGVASFEGVKDTITKAMGEQNSET